MEVVSTQWILAGELQSTVEPDSDEVGCDIITTSGSVSQEYSLLVDIQQLQHITFRNCNPAHWIQQHIDRLWGSKGYEVVIAREDDDLSSAVHLLEFPCELDYEGIGLILGDKNLAFIVRNKYSYLKTIAFHHLNDHLDKPEWRPPHAIGKLLLGSCHRSPAGWG